MFWKNLQSNLALEVCHPQMKFYFHALLNPLAICEFTLLISVGLFAVMTQLTQSYCCSIYLGDNNGLLRCQTSPPTILHPVDGLVGPAVSAGYKFSAGHMGNTFLARLLILHLCGICIR